MVAKATAHSLTFVLGMMALEPEEQERLYAHIGEVLGERNPVRMVDLVSVMTRFDRPWTIRHSRITPGWIVCLPCFMRLYVSSPPYVQAMTLTHAQMS